MTGKDIQIALGVDVDAVAEHEMAAFAAAKADASHPSGDTDPVTDLRAGWEMTIEFGLANPELFALVSDPARATDSPATRAGIQLLAEKVHRVALAGRLRVAEDRAVDIIHAAGTGAVLALLSQPAAERDLSLATSMLEASLAQLVTGTGVPTEDRSATTAAVTLRAEAPHLSALSTSERLLLTDWLDRVIAQDTAHHHP